jgi:hypothetical protein
MTGVAVVVAAATGTAGPQPEPPGVGSTIAIPSMPGAYGAFSMTLLQVFGQYRWNKPGNSGSHPYFVRIRISDTGTSTFGGEAEEALLDAHILLLGHEYPAYAPAMVLHDTLGLPPGCPSGLSGWIFSFRPGPLMPGSTRVGCVAFQLPVHRDLTTLQFCWTPDAQVTLFGAGPQQPTYCWTINNDRPSVNV